MQLFSTAVVFFCVALAIRIEGRNFVRTGERAEEAEPALIEAGCSDQNQA